MAVEPYELVSTGLAALCGVDDGAFNDKHWGAATIAAGLFAGRAAPDTRASMTHQAEQLIEAKASWFPPPVQSSRGDTAPIVERLSRSVGELHLLGHDTIFASLGLQAMSVLPTLATEANIDAVVSLIDTAAARGPGGPFPGWDDPAVVRADEHDGDPIETLQDLAVSALDTFAAAGPVEDGRDRGVVQHVLTHAQALVDLYRLGHVHVATAGFAAHRTYRKLMTKRPSTVDEPLPEQAPIPDFGVATYWDRLGTGHDWLFGHVFKLAYAWPLLVELVPTEVRRRAEPMLATTMVIT